MTQRKFWTNFINYIQTNHAKYRNNYQQKWANKLHSCKHEFSKREIMSRSVSRLNKAEALINSQCTLASTLCND